MYKAFEHTSGRWYVARVFSDGTHARSSAPELFSTRGKAERHARRMNTE